MSARICGERFGMQFFEYVVRKPAVRSLIRLSQCGTSARSWCGVMFSFLCVCAALVSEIRASALWPIAAASELDNLPIVTLRVAPPTNPHPQVLAPRTAIWFVVHSLHFVR